MQKPAKTSSHSHTAEFWAPAESHAFTFKVWTATRFFSKVHSDPKASHTSLCAQGEGTEWNALGEIYVLVPGCWIFEHLALRVLFRASRVSILLVGPRLDWACCYCLSGKKILNRWGLDGATAAWHAATINVWTCFHHTLLQSEKSRYRYIDSRPCLLHFLSTVWVDVFLLPQHACMSPLTSLVLWHLLTFNLF